MSAKAARRSSLNQAAAVDPDEAVWKALGDSSRRRMLDLLRTRARTTSELCGEFDTSRFAVMKHLAVLVQAGLVIVERKGRERWNHLNPVPIQHIHRRWIRPFEAQPADGLLRLKAQAERSSAKPTKNTRKSKLR